MKAVGTLNASPVTLSAKFSKEIELLIALVENIGYAFPVRILWF
jgi:hypothetical protein